MMINRMFFSLLYIANALLLSSCQPKDIVTDGNSSILKILYVDEMNVEAIYLGRMGPIRTDLDSAIHKYKSTIVDGDDVRLRDINKKYVTMGISSEGSCISFQNVAFFFSNVLVINKKYKCNGFVYIPIKCNSKSWTPSGEKCDRFHVNVYCLKDVDYECQNSGLDVSNENPSDLTVHRPIVEYIYDSARGVTFFTIFSESGSAESNYTLISPTGFNEMTLTMFKKSLNSQKTSPKL
jgi:hypothetical protein